jgi:hypothetical protein
MRTRVFRMKMTAGLAGVLLFAVMTTVGSAHHSFAMYDLTISKTLTGKLTRFVIGANHSQLIFELINPDGTTQLDANGKPITWGVETGSARQIAEKGVTAKNFQYGTIMTITLHPLRDGRNFGALRNEDGLLIGCGTKMPEGGCTEKTGTLYIGGNSKG